MSSEDVNPDLAQQSNEINEGIMCCALENVQMQKDGLKIITKLDQQHSIQIDQYWYFFTKKIVKVGTLGIDALLEYICLFPLSMFF